jgi:tRNA-Thr(GGU) m(6)t(6)A37 methyltransferase TsaA
MIMKNADQDIQIRAIGHMRSCFQHKFGTPRQGSLTPSSRGRIELDKTWIGSGSFEGLTGFSHVWLITWLHRFNHDRDQMKSKVHPPRLEGQSLGIFATRSPHHPNPIGLTLAKLESVGEHAIEVSGIDIIEGTPILDIKPYLPMADRPEEFTHGWLSTIENKVWDVRFTPESLMQLQALNTETPFAEFQKLIVEMIKEDPRPLSYREKNTEPYAAHLYDVNVVFEFLGDHFLVTRCEAKSQGQNSRQIKKSPIGPTLNP